MAGVASIRKERKKDILEALKIIDIYAEWIKGKPNKIWSKKQADLFKSVYGAINADWRKSLAKQVAP